MEQSQKRQQSNTKGEEPEPKTYAIGDYTWIDENKNGIQDKDEEVLPGVKVELYDETGKTLIKTTTTDEKGLYIFDELEAGTYKIKFILTEDQAAIYEFTQQVEDNPTEDSNANPLNGWTVEITLNDDNEYLTKDYTDQTVKATQGIDPTWDAGVVLKKHQ